MAWAWDARPANAAAAIAVSKSGTATVSMAELRARILPAAALALINAHEFGNGVACFTSDGNVAREFGREANADMGFKAIWWLAALAGENNKYDGKVWDYQPVWGTGNGIVELTPNPNKELDFEKEFDGDGIGVAQRDGGRPGCRPSQRDVVAGGVA